MEQVFSVIGNVVVSAVNDVMNYPFIIELKKFLLGTIKKYLRHFGAKWQLWHKCTCQKNAEERKVIPWIKMIGSNSTRNYHFPKQQWFY